MTDQPRTWDLYSTRQTDGPDGTTWYRGFGPEAMFLSMYGENHSGLRVRLIEDPDGDYAGWISYERDSDMIEMVQRKEIFAIQFAYGGQAEEAAGGGKAVRLRVEELD